MKSIQLLFIVTIMTFGIYKVSASSIPEQQIGQIIEQLVTKHGSEARFRAERGVRQAAIYWNSNNGSLEEFTTYCNNEFVSDPSELDALFNTLSDNLETIYGHLGMIGTRLRFNMDVERGKLTKTDLMFAGFNPSSHLAEDLIASKIAHLIALNFPTYTLAEKNNLGRNWDRRQWAYARLGDTEFFSASIPSEIKREMSQKMTDADMYISGYNIYMGSLRNDKGDKLFPDGMKLLSHWNLRDEIKANYADKEKGIEKQRMVYRVMEHIVNQSIPIEVINSDSHLWNPYANTIEKDGKKIVGTPETDRRYEQIRNIFRLMRACDKYYPEDQNTYIKRKFRGEMEMDEAAVESMFVEFVSSPEAAEVGRIVSERLGRPLEPFDIWYDGFKSRSSMDQGMLTDKTSTLYPDAKALEAAVPSILTGLGFSENRSLELSKHISVDAARGSGHAMGPAMRGDNARLRTRIGTDGMDYKGYNIAIHELGHNVEQVISLYNVDHYMLSGVPNTSFTEALAFLFQARDLQILGIKDTKDARLENLDAFWSAYEIMGVSIVDIRLWRWMYDNENASATEIRDAAVRIAKEVWNSYYAPVFGVRDSPVLAVYSHMVSYPLYLSAYSFGQLIHFQIEEFLAGKNNEQLANEIDRIYRLGRLTPDVWMIQATGNQVSIHPTLNSVKTSNK